MLKKSQYNVFKISLILLLSVLIKSTTFACYAYIELDFGNCVGKGDCIKIEVIPVPSEGWFVFAPTPCESKIEIN